MHAGVIADALAAALPPQRAMRILCCDAAGAPSAADTAAMLGPDWLGAQQVAIEETDLALLTPYRDKRAQSSIGACDDSITG